MSAGNPAAFEALIPGLFAGLATGSKYTSAVVIAPVLIAILFYVKAGHRIWACLTAIAIMIVTFLVVVPYSVLDIPTFLNGLAFNARHYAAGPTGADGEPGLPQLLFYGRHFVSDFGVGASLALTLVAVPFWHIPDQLSDHTDSRRLAQAWIETRFPPGWTIVVPPQLNFDTRGIEGKGSHVTVVDLKSAQDTSELDRLLTGVRQPAVIVLPLWGADRRFEGQKLADALNEASRPWRVLKTFGTRPVLVNYSPPTGNGDPAFAIALLDRGGLPTH